MKKLLSIALVVVLLAGIAISGTMAYLTAEDSDVNVMTLGNVKIEQIEQERNEDGELVKFSQLKPLFPAVGPIEWANKGVVVNDTEYKVFTDELNNVVDKIVTVNNTGKSDAYIRTVIAFEAPEGFNDDLLHFNYNGTDVTTGDWMYVEIEGERYVVNTFTYTNALAAGAKSAPSLMQVFLDSAAKNEDVALLGDEYEILVVSQAVQTAGFANAAAALDEAFPKGEDNKNVPGWFANANQTMIKNANQAYKIFSSYDQSGESGTVILGADYNTADAEKHWSGNREYALRAAGTDVTFNLNGHTVNHNTTYQDGKNTGYTYLFTTAYNGKLTVNGEGTVNSANSEGQVNIFYAQGPSEVVINGGEYNVNKGIAVWAGANSKVTINGGRFISNNIDQELIYSSGGIIDIYDGFFQSMNGGRVLNVNDGNKTASINLYGGTYVNFDPTKIGDPNNQDPDNIKVMEGYKVVSETQTNGDIWYTVVPE